VGSFVTKTTDGAFGKMKLSWWGLINPDDGGRGGTDFIDEGGEI